MGDALRNDGYTRRYTRAFFADPTVTSAAYVLLLLFNTQNPIARVAAPTGKYTLTRVREGYNTRTGRATKRKQGAGMAGKKAQTWSETNAQARYKRAVERGPVRGS